MAEGQKEERIALGMHIVATATLSSPGATRVELDLAGEILKRDPKRSSPRESATPIDTFNRHMDAAIDSVSDSVGLSTRAERRARLARDLDRAGLLLVDRSYLAELLEPTIVGPAPGTIWINEAVYLPAEAIAAIEDPRGEWTTFDPDGADPLGDGSDYGLTGLVGWQCHDPNVND